MHPQVWGGLCKRGKLPLVFIEKGVKINAEYYKKGNPGISCTSELSEIIWRGLLLLSTGRSPFTKRQVKLRRGFLKI